MNLLAIDTSTPRFALVLAAADRRFERVGDPAGSGGRHGRELLPAIQALIRSAGLVPGELDAIAVGLGPGSYTGLRVGITAAKTLAFALGKPLVGVDSFAAIARNAPPDAASVHVVADAQRGDIYLREFAGPAAEGTMTSLGPVRVVAMGPWAESLAPATWVLGPTLDRLRVAWPAGVRLGDVAQGFPSGEALVALGCEAIRTERWADPATIEPSYVRRSAAEDQWDKLGRKS